MENILIKRKQGEKNPQVLSALLAYVNLCINTQIYFYMYLCEKEKSQRLK